MIPRRLAWLLCKVTRTNRGGIIEGDICSNGSNFKPEGIEIRKEDKGQGIGVLMSGMGMEDGKKGC